MRKMDKEMLRLFRIKIELARKRPRFLRQEWFRYKKLGEKWRKPKGKHSKMREKKKYRPPVVDIGYRGPKKVRGLHPSGYKEVLIYNAKQLMEINPETEAVKIASSVGKRKRMEIYEKAKSLGIRILNYRGE
ncbi:MAG: 50S ribosomal protein L32e [Thermoplasmata archaeon]